MKYPFDKHTAITVKIFKPAIWRLVFMTTLALLLLSFSLQAQDTYPHTRFGIRGGVNLNSWTNEFPFYTEGGQSFSPDSWKATVGFHGGIYANVRVSRLIAIEPGVYYSVKGTAMTAEAGGMEGEATIVSNYIDIPVLLRLYVADGFNLFLGPQLAYQISSQFDATVDGMTVVDNQDLSDDISELDFMLVLGAGYEFKGGFNINLSGEFGFATVDPYEVLDTYNRTIRVSVGYSF